MNKIIDIFHATDGYDVTVLTHNAERKTFHFSFINGVPENLQELIDNIITNSEQPKVEHKEPILTNNTEIILDEAYYSMLNIISNIWSTL